VKKAFTIAKENGVITAYDPNYSSIISTPEDAKEYFEEIIDLTDILFMSSKYDTKSIFEISSLENITKSVADRGVETIIIKSSANKGYHLYNQRNSTFVPFYTNHVVDTTSSGDAFNGAFLHAIANSYTPTEAAKIASIDAGLQAQGIGAIKSIPHKEEVYNIYKSEE
jgi:2-dehydro-3-deoxygluconokinase